MLCQVISSFEERKCREDREKTGVFVNHLSPQEYAQVVRLVGRKCTVKCLLNGAEANALWGTGAQVSIILHSCLKRSLSGCHNRGHILHGSSHNYSLPPYSHPDVRTYHVLL